MQGRYRTAVLLLGVMSSALAAAQVRLPAVQLPALPVAPLTSDVSEFGRETLGRLAELRREHLRLLIRANRHSIEADPNGDPIVRSEILSLSETPPAAAAVAGLGLTLAREEVIPGLNTRLVVWRVPPSTATRRALKQLRDLDPNGTYDYNHIYSDSGAALPGPGTAQPPSTSISADHPDNSSLRIGLIDSGVDANHPAFHASAIHAWGCGDVRMAGVHGTSVASLLIGGAAEFQGVQPGAQLYAADVYCNQATGGAVDVIAAALGWMVQERVPVINVSLVGPRNAMLEKVVQAVIAHGHLVVAAVGNDGPAAAPLYPASYADVVGVSGVDAHRHILIEAGRGACVMFTAPGADMLAAVPGGDYKAVRGTSFAAPIIAGLLARQLPEPDKDAAARAISILAQQAVDLGPPGRDVTYGYGLLGETYRVDPGRPHKK